MSYRPTLDDLSARGADQLIGWLKSEISLNTRTGRQALSFLRDLNHRLDRDPFFTPEALAKMRGEAGK